MRWRIGGVSVAWRNLLLGWLVAVVCCSAGFGQISVSEQTAAAGMTAMHQADPVSMGAQGDQTSGVAVGDFNKDGWPDVFFLGGGLTADKLFINDGDGTFTNQAVQWGVSVLHGGCGAAVGDYDGDGWLDIYVTSFGPAGVPGQAGKHRLYHNNQNNTFSEVAQAAGVNQTTVGYANGYGAAWGDYDLDGKLDLFVTAWKDMAAGNNGTGNRLFHNNGNGTFTDVTVAALGTAMVGVYGFQPSFVDMNGDRLPELLIAADFTTSRYLKNNGNGTFTNLTLASGTGLDNNGMGQTVGDFNRDGIFDWYVTSIFGASVPHPGNMLYWGQGNHLFVEGSAAAGCIDGGWGWGTVAVDLDQDGWQDIIEVNGRDAPGGEWQNEREYMWRNLGNGTFQEVGNASGFNVLGEGRGLAILDADNDGDQDFVILDHNRPFHYFRNNSSTGGRWLNVSLNTSTNPLLAPDGFGSRVTVVVGGVSHVRFQSGSPSYLSTSDLRLHFGLGNAPIIDQVRVDWARGNTTVLNKVAVNQFITITAPKPTDVTADGVVNIDDLLAVINAWGPCGPPCASDVNNTHTVNIDDLLAVINQWG